MDALHGWAERYGAVVPVAPAGMPGRVGRRGGAGETGDEATRRRSGEAASRVAPGAAGDGSGAASRDGSHPGIGAPSPHGLTGPPDGVGRRTPSRRDDAEDAGGACGRTEGALWRGQIDEAGRDVLRGWAFDARRPGQPVSLLVMLDGALLGRVVANGFRRDLADAGIGAGRHGFELRFESRLSPLRAHRIRVLREEDGADLTRSPWVIEAAGRLDDPDLERLGGLLLEGLESDPALLRRRAGFLVEQLDRMLAVGGAAAPDAEGWRKARLLAPAASPEAAPVPAAERPLALVIDELVPDGARDAGSSAILSHMRALLRLGFRVLFAAADPAPAPVLCDALSRDGIESCNAPFFASVEEVLRRHGSALSLVYLHRGSLGSRYARLVRHHCRDARLLLSVADLQHLRLARQARFEQRDELLTLARSAETQELDAMVQADAVLTHSAEEAEAIRRALPGKPVHRVMWTASTVAVRAGFAARAGVAFLADYAHAPNLDAARRLVGEIMPLVWEHEPAMPCLLAGSRLPHGFGGGDPRVLWIGHVPTLQELFERVRLTVAPLAFGAGIKGKVLESLAAGVPCACSPIAAEGLGLPPVLAELVANDTHGLARLILRLHGDPALNARVAEAGLDWAASTLSEEQLDAALGQAIGR